MIGNRVPWQMPRSSDLVDCWGIFGDACCQDRYRWTSLAWKYTLKRRQYLTWSTISECEGMSYSVKPWLDLSFREKNRTSELFWQGGSTGQASVGLWKSQHICRDKGNPASKSNRSCWPDIWLRGRFYWHNPECLVEHVATARLFFEPLEKPSLSRCIFKF